MNEKWCREETMVALNAYCKIPFKDCNKFHPLIVEYAQLIGRSASALNMKVGNIGRLDPHLQEHGIKGLTHGSKIEVEVWNEFVRNPEWVAFESESIISRLKKQTIEESIDPILKKIPHGTEREVLIKQRVNQSFFRTMVLSAYNFRCCISGVSNSCLLEACHISGLEN